MHCDEPVKTEFMCYVGTEQYVLQKFIIESLNRQRTSTLQKTNYFRFKCAWCSLHTNYDVCDKNALRRVTNYSLDFRVEFSSSLNIWKTWQRTWLHSSSSQTARRWKNSMRYSLIYLQFPTLILLLAFFFPKCACSPPFHHNNIRPFLSIFSGFPYRTGHHLWTSKDDMKEIVCFSKHFAQTDHEDQAGAQDFPDFSEKMLKRLCAQGFNSTSVWGLAIAGGGIAIVIFYDKTRTGFEKEM